MLGHTCAKREGMPNTLEVNPETIDNVSDCICEFFKLFSTKLDEISNKRQIFIALIDKLIEGLTALKIILLLFNVDWENLARKKALELTIAAMDKAVGVVSAPVNLALGYTRMYADCDPVNTLGKHIKTFRNKALAEYANLKYDVEQFILAMEDKKQELENIDRIIDDLTEIKSKIQACGL